jgi:hypothetical protein
MALTKKCSHCGEVKSIADFPRDKGTRDGYSYSCRLCRQESRRRFMEKNPGYAEMESWRRRYGLSRGEYQKMFDDQEGCCFICGKKKKLHVDHSHTTNKVRALLCHNCNSVLGYSREDPAILRAGIEYLRLFKAKTEET